MQVSSGKQHTSGHAKAALGRLPDELHDRRPALVRGDSGYGNESILLELEGRAQPYLLRLRQMDLPRFHGHNGLRLSLLRFNADDVGGLRCRVIQRACLWTSRRVCDAALRRLVHRCEAPVG